ncbi:hypothetical protein D9756_009264 [Leucocoprinus leucothites]|uniref:PLC-like phosphodiesterase n=1 Tax=Leucocoprinus leucothites TaxID=201217 RepID=A0A8H5FV81_9AGAR|nr:hypothetical protein D9756_009264 [Leucoagaricus leucothites]
MQVASLRLAALILALYGRAVSGMTLPSRRDPACNGHPQLCGRHYGNTTFLGSHDSFAHSKNPLALARTQTVDITAQLKLGVRMLQAQGRVHNNVLNFCHTSCKLFNGGTVEKYLKTVKEFLDKHPNEVLTFIFTNPENASIEKFWKPAFDKSGITPVLYIPPHFPMKRDDWPTLGEMIKSKKRVVAFIDSSATNKTGKPIVNSILPEFNMVWEDPYSSTNDKFPCKVDRTNGPLKPTEQLNMINHNFNKKIIPIGAGVLVSDHHRASQINSVKSILAHAYGCAGFANHRSPNFVLLDYVDIGEGMKAVNELNGF